MSNMYGQDPQTPQPQPGAYQNDPYAQAPQTQPGAYQAAPYGQAPQAAPMRPPHNFVQAWKAFFANYVNFYGRANRSEFWYVVGSLFVFSSILGSIQNSFDPSTPGYMMLSAISALVGLATLLPHLGLWARRLHDAGFSAWFLLLNFVLVLGQIALIIMACMPSKPEGVRFDNPSGEQPKLGTV